MLIFQLYCRFSKDDLEKYKQVIDACNEPVVPTCFLECSFIPLMLMGVTTTEFRLSPIGIVYALRLAIKVCLLTRANPHSTDHKRVF